MSSFEGRYGRGLYPKHSWDAVAQIPDTVRRLEGLMRALLTMRRVRLLIPAAMFAALSVAASGQAPATVTVFEGARVIVGDGRAPIENASFVVSGTRFLQVGRAADVRVPAGATRVNLAGKTVMPAIIDTHTHLSQTREMLLDDLRRRAYFGVGAALSLGQDTTDASFEVRAQTLPGLPGFSRRAAGSRGRSRAARPLRTGSRPSRKHGRRFRKTRRRKSTSSSSGSTIAWAP